MDKHNATLGRMAERLTKSERRHLRQAPRGAGHPVKDPYGSRSHQQHMLNRSAQIIYGRIIDTLPGIHFYKVHPEKGGIPISCCASSTGAAGPMGTTQSSPYSPGQRVYYIKHPHNVHGVIIGAEPLSAQDARRSLNDQISMSSNCGVQVDRIHQTPFSLGKKHGIVDWSHGRPTDTVTGDYTWISDTGTAVHIDPFMTFLRADENTGIWGFYKNQHLRVAGHNYQQWSAGIEEEVIDDQGELSSFQGQTMFPWEYMGTGRTTQPYQEIQPEEYQLKNTWKASLEPKEYDQEPFYRYHRYGGYLGQGKASYVVAPEETQSSPNTLSNPANRQALFEERTMPEGTHAIRSARRILLQKTPNIAHPVRIKRPNDLRGDSTDSGYDFAGAQGSHKVAPGPTIPLTDTPGRDKAAFANDQHAYLWNWQGSHPFYYHNKDFNFPEESESGRQIDPPQFSSLSGRQDLPEPQQSQVYVDHRYGKVPVYHSDSYIDMMDDGGIVIADGYGSSLTMTGGHIYLNCPGDIFLGPGRNLIGWAGKNMSMKARKEAEVSVTDGSLRLKAEKHMMLLSGNGGQGSMLIENRGDGDPQFDQSFHTGDEWGQAVNGVLIKSVSDIDTWSKSVYVRTGGGDIADGGGITLDSNKGKSFIRTHCQNFHRFIQGSAYDVFGEEDNIEKVNYFSRDVALLDSKLSVTDILSVEASIVAKSNIMVASGHIITSEAKNFEYLVGELKDEALTEANDYLQKAGEDFTDKLNDDESEVYSAFNDSVYETGFAGNDGSIMATGFSFRKTSEYGTTDFILHDARWQAISRSSGGGDTWTEKSVDQGDDETYPFPGKEATVDNQALRVTQATLYTPSTGFAKSRASGVFENPVLPAAEKRNLQGGYLVTG